jgi:hypothetical protein
MKKILLLTTFSFAVATGFSQSFEKVFYSGGASFAQQTSDGGFIVATSTNFWMPGSLLKLGANGDTAWARFYNFISLNCVKQTADGGYIFSASEQLNTGHKVALFTKTDASGNTLFTKTFSPCTWDSYGGVVNQAQDGTFYFDVSGDDGTSSQPYILYHLDSLGNVKWTLTDPWYSFQLIPSSAMIVSGNSVFCASTFSIMCDVDYISLAQINSNGSIDVQKTFADMSYIHYFTFPAQGYGAASLSRNAEGNIVVAGYTNSSPSQCDYTVGFQYLLMTGASGDSLWSKVYDQGYLNDAEFTSDGRIIMVGKTAGITGFLLRMTDMNGNILWDKYFTGNGNASAYSVRETSDGGFVIAAATTGYVYVVKTDSEGNGNEVTGISSPENVQHVSVFPNPFSVSATINISAGELSQRPSFTLYDAIGNEVRNFSLYETTTMLRKQNLAAGIYFYTVKTSAAEIARGKLVVE